MSKLDKEFTNKNKKKFMEICLENLYNDYLSIYV